MDTVSKCQNERNPYRSDPLEGGGTIYSNGFFVQSILTDRYIYHTEL